MVITYSSKSISKDQPGTVANPVIYRRCFYLLWAGNHY